jgi:hypothetical protein
MHSRAWGTGGRGQSGVNPKIETRELGTHLVKWKGGVNPKIETRELGIHLVKWKGGVNPLGETQ